MHALLKGRNRVSVLAIFSQSHSVERFPPEGPQTVAAVNIINRQRCLLWYLTTFSRQTWKPFSHTADCRTEFGIITVQVGLRSKQKDPHSLLITWHRHSRRAHGGGIHPRHLTDGNWVLPSVWARGGGAVSTWRPAAQESEVSVHWAGLPQGATLGSGLFTSYFEK